jgi:membrane protein DedA with SNARE-associated domain
VIASLAERILHLHGWVAGALIFVLAALECSAFLGIIVPGEVAVIVGGVLAFQGRIPLWAAMVAAVVGASIGDSIGYVIGKRWGRRILHWASGRMIKPHHLDRAEAYLRRRGGSAVFLGRFTAALRVLVPSLAGMSNMHYPTFLVFNVAGAVAWGTGFTLLGYFAGASWRQVERVASRTGLVLLGLVVVGFAVAFLVRRIRRRRSKPPEA